MDDLVIKMATSYSRYLKFRADHGIHDLLNGKNMFNFWSDYSKFTKYLAKRNKDYFIDEVKELEIKKIIELYKEHYFKKDYKKMKKIL